MALAKNKATPVRLSNIVKGRKADKEKQMKRAGNLYARICSRENCMAAIHAACRHKLHRASARKLNEWPEAYVEYIQTLLETKTYKPSPYIVCKISDGISKKDRIIHKPKLYPDLCIQWALMQVIEPIIMRGAYHWSCGSIPGKGIMHGVKGVKRWLRQDPEGTKYCLKLDIRKFYPSIDTAVLKAQFRRVIKDEGALWLIDKIIDSHPQGLPIGNYTSQWWSNFYLQGLDHFIKESITVPARRGGKRHIAIPYYCRYVDDMTLFSGNKKHLHAARRQIFEYLERELHVQIKDNWQLFKTDSRGVDFLGYRFFHGRTILRKRNALRMARRARKTSKKQPPSLLDAQAMVSYYGAMKHCDSHNFMMKHITPYVDIEKLKKVISDASKEQRAARRGVQRGANRGRVVQRVHCAQHQALPAP